MLRYVDGGKRYLPGEWPTEPMPFFEEEGSVTVYDERARRRCRTTRRGRARPPPAAEFATIGDRAGRRLTPKRHGVRGEVMANEVTPSETNGASPGAVARAHAEALRADRAGRHRDRRRHRDSRAAAVTTTTTGADRRGTAARSTAIGRRRTPRPKRPGNVDDYEWPDTCDTETGRLKIPIHNVYPCVAPWDETDNGGATSPGVTADEIIVAVYKGQPDPLAQALVEDAGADTDPNVNHETELDYLTMYETIAETYGRTLRVETIEATGGADDATAAQADAQKVIDMGAFAAIGGPGQTPAW